MAAAAVATQPPQAALAPGLIELPALHPNVQKMLAERATPRYEYTAEDWNSIIDMCNGDMMHLVEMFGKVNKPSPKSKSKINWTGVEVQLKHPHYQDDGKAVFGPMLIRMGSRYKPIKFYGLSHGWTTDKLPFEADEMPKSSRELIMDHKQFKQYSRSRRMTLKVVPGEDAEFDKLCKRIDAVCRQIWTRFVDSKGAGVQHSIVSQAQKTPENHYFNWKIDLEDEDMLLDEDVQLALNKLLAEYRKKNPDQFIPVVTRHTEVYKIIGWTADDEPLLERIRDVRAYVEPLTFSGTSKPIYALTTTAFTDIATKSAPAWSGKFFLKRLMIMDAPPSHGGLATSDVVAPPSGSLKMLLQQQKEQEEKEIDYDALEQTALSTKSKKRSASEMLPSPPSEVTAPNEPTAEQEPQQDASSNQVVADAEVNPEATGSFEEAAEDNAASRSKLPAIAMEPEEETNE
jgi:hypothetical protein